VAYYGLDGFSGLRVKGKVGNVVGFEVGFDCCKIRQGFCHNPGFVCSVPELNVLIDHALDEFLQLQQLLQLGAA
jgi:hypothetical protein